MSDLPTTVPDQLDVQIHLEIVAIRKEFDAAQARVAAWWPTRPENVEEPK